MENSRNILIFDTPEQLAEAAAERFVNFAQESITRQGQFSVALAGGNTPRRVYELLASERFKGRVEWPNVHLFFGDERCVPPDHPDSNYRMANEALITHVPIPPANVHRMAGEGEPSVSAALYETQLRQFFGNVTWPSFDLVFLGLGKDGHTASLFPQTKALTEDNMWVVANWVEGLGVHRLTLTVPVLNHARRIIFLVTGYDKAKTLKDVLTGAKDPLRLPAQLIAPSEGTCEWLIDKAAASSLA
jgi:6-phosphogluconolactonase